MLLIASAGVLVGAKTDQSLRRVVSTKQAEEFAKQHGLAYFETSAQEGVDVEAPFYFVASTFHEQFEEQVRLFVKASQEAH